VSSIPLDRAHGGAGFEAGAALDFSVSLNPLGPPPEVVEAYVAAAARLDRYPDPDAPRLRAAVARRHDLPEDRVLVAAGSTAVFHLLARELELARPHVLIPTFSGIANALLVEGRCPEAIELSAEDRFAWPEEAVRGALDAGAGAIFLGRPNSPTGSLVEKRAALELVAACEARRVWCVIDEAFVDFAGEDESLVIEAANSTRLVVIRSLTKIFAMPALRVGYAVGPAALVERLAARREPWSIAGPAEAASLAALALPSSFFERTRSVVTEERSRLELALATAGLTTFPSSANFVLAFDREHRRRRVPDLLRSAGILVRDLASLPGLGPGFLRVGVRAPVANEALRKALETRLRDA
jgi:threonine-phosphate decarboxylase